MIRDALIEIRCNRPGCMYYQTIYVKGYRHYTGDPRLIYGFDVDEINRKLEAKFNWITKGWIHYCSKECDEARK